MPSKRLNGLSPRMNENTYCPVSLPILGIVFLLIFISLINYFNLPFPGYSEHFSYVIDHYFYCKFLLNIFYPLTRSPFSLIFKRCLWIKVIGTLLVICLISNFATFLLSFRFHGEGNRRIKKYVFKLSNPSFMVSPFCIVLKKSFPTEKLCKYLLLFPSRIFIVLCSHLNLSPGICLDVKVWDKNKLNCFSKWLASRFYTIFEKSTLSPLFKKVTLFYTKLT